MDPGSPASLWKRRHRADFQAARGLQPFAHMRRTSSLRVVLVALVSAGLVAAAPSTARAQTAGINMGAPVYDGVVADDAVVAGGASRGEPSEASGAGRDRQREPDRREGRGRATG